MSFRNRRAAPSADQAVGELLSWVVGRKHARPGRSRTDTAVGELLSWIVGRRRRRSPPASSPRAPAARRR